MEHRLVNDTLESTKHGIIARCTCGWTSGYRISSFVASAIFRDHKEGGELTLPPTTRSGEGDKGE